MRFVRERLRLLVVCEIFFFVSCVGGLCVENAFFLDDSIVLLCFLISSLIFFVMSLLIG